MTNLKLVFTLFTVFAMFACSEKDLLTEDLNQVPPQEIPADVNGDSFISPEQAIAIAGKYLSRESGIKTRSLENASVEMVRDEKNGGIPAMYAVSYPEGGWAIISATRNYFPVLAHSDKGSFNLENVIFSGVSVWIEETKDAVRVSKDLADSTRVKISNQWLVYEEAKTSSVLQTRNWNHFHDRIAQLKQLYQNEWSYMTLDDASVYIDALTHQTIVNEGIAFGAELEYTIVGVRNYDSNYYKNGPLLTTKWNQDAPFSDLCNNCPLAGCAPIAIAQIMRFHERPADLELYGTPIDWSDMYDAVYATLATQTLIRELGWNMGIAYGILNCDVGVNPNDIGDALSEFGYSYIKQNHNPGMVNANIMADKPVAMGGFPPSGPGHRWVCDGLEQWYTYTEFFVEYYVSGSYNRYGYVPVDPGISTSNFSYYSMNWGWGGTNDGWFSENEYPSGKNYQYGRINYYITPPV